MGVFAGVEPTWASQTNIGRTHIATKGVVQSGLVLNLDAGVSSSYPGSGTTWTDLSGNGNNGTLVNGVGYSGTNGGSLSFDGTNDYVTTSTNNLNLSELTICAWVKFDSFNNTLFPTITNKETSNTARNWWVGVNPSGSGSFVFSRSVSGVDSSVSTTNLSLSLNQWYYVCGTNNLTPIFSIYINGSLNNTSTLSGTLSTNGTANWIGTYRDLIYPMDGNISNLKIYNKALTASEIQQNFNATRSRFGI